MILLSKYQSRINARLKKAIPNKAPKDLYEPILYAIEGGGKRLRPILTILSAKAVSGSDTNAWHAAVAVELFHNFTLIHDDIMDKADLRHNRPPVYKKWDTDVAILSGDAAFALAFRELVKTKTKHLDKLANVFIESSILVCEGQSMDKAFETQKHVTLNDYFALIKNKTGKLIQSSIELGAIAGGCASGKQYTAFRHFGLALGTAFQLQDDLLDVVAETQSFGKMKGGDIMQGKRTFLLIKALENATGSDLKSLQELLANKGCSKSDVPHIIDIFDKTGSINATANEVKKITTKAMRYLPKDKKANDLRELAEYLLKRTF